MAGIMLQGAFNRNLSGKANSALLLFLINIISSTERRQQFAWEETYFCDGQGMEFPARNLILLKI